MAQRAHLPTDFGTSRPTDCWPPESDRCARTHRRYLLTWKTRRPSPVCPNAARKALAAVSEIDTLEELENCSLSHSGQEQPLDMAAPVILIRLVLLEIGRQATFHRLQSARFIECFRALFRSRIVLSFIRVDSHDPSPDAGLFLFNHGGGGVEFAV